MHLGVPDLGEDPRLELFDRTMHESLLGTVAQVAEVHDEPDVTWVLSTVPYPQFNGASHARFQAGAAVRRTHETLDRLMDHGNPFLWELTPRTRSPELESVLVERGLTAGRPEVGMYVDLADVASLHEPLPAAVTVETATDAEQQRVLASALARGFAMPEELVAPVEEFLAISDTDRVANRAVLVRLDGEPAGGGTLAASHGVAALFNIAVVEEARGKGIGRAATLELLRLAAGLGCRASVLTASPLGASVYTRIGFQPLCEVEQYVWQPVAG